MTEAEWLECADPLLILEFLRGKASDRKLRLFAVSRCRHIWSLLADETSRATVDVAERAADGVASLDELEGARRAIPSAGERATMTSASWVAFEAVSETCWAARSIHEIHSHVARAVRCALMAEEYAVPGTIDRSRPCRLLREIVGNPFRP